MVFFKESNKQIITRLNIQNSSSFSDWMHSPLWTTYIDCFNSSIWRDHSSNSWSTWRIVFNNEFLNWNLSFFSKNFHNRNWNSISSIGLIDVSFYSDSFIDFNLMIHLMLFLIIWMNRMSHISWNLEASE